MTYFTTYDTLVETIGNIMNAKKAKENGYSLVRGAYVGTCDDRADRWYVQHESDRVIDRRGAGYLTKKDAYDAIDYRLRLCQCE